MRRPSKMTACSDVNPRRWRLARQKGEAYLQIRKFLSFGASDWIGELASLDCAVNLV